MKLGQIVHDELTFKSRISKMGDNRIIWIPVALREMIREFEKGDILVSIKKASKK
jgi:hypothetical protein